MKNFTKDELKDGMVCTTRNGGSWVKSGARVARTSGGLNDLGKYCDDLTVHAKFDSNGLDIMKITYGTETVYEREEWQEVAPDEAYEMLKEGPIEGQGCMVARECWASDRLEAIAPCSSNSFHCHSNYYEKFRIKKEY